MLLFYIYENRYDVIYNVIITKRIREVKIKVIIKNAERLQKNRKAAAQEDVLERKDLLAEQLKRYRDTDAYPFHMPGHKRRTDVEFLRSYPNPYGIDITEIDGFDNLHHPEGILKKSMEWAAKVYGADKTYYLINGSSCGILSAVSAAVSFGGRILMSRNCHKSAYHGVILNHLKSAYIYPQIIEPLGIQGGISAEDVEILLEKYPDTEAVLVVSPTYDGIVSDIRKIAEVVHRRGLPLIVDEAHGAHFSFDDGDALDGSGKGRIFPVSAISCGADLVIQSLHKTLPSLTQTAVLHVKKGYINIKRLEHYLQIYQSSSPSYVLMAGIEACIFEMHSHAGKWYSDFQCRLNELRRSLGELCNLKLLDNSAVGSCGVFDLDRSKIVVSCRNCEWEPAGGERKNFSGSDLADWLRREYHLEMEMCGADYIVAITTFMDTQEGLQRLKRSLLEIDSRLYKTESQAGTRAYCREADICMTISEAEEAEKERILISRCAGRISAEFVYLYPPGIPVAAPGERITDEIVHLILSYREMGLPVQGMEDEHALYLYVIR